MKNKEFIHDLDDCFRLLGASKDRFIDAGILKERALYYEQLYFEDFTFQEGSIARDIFLEKQQHIFSQPKRKGYYAQEYHGAPTISRVNFKIQNLQRKNAEGVYNTKTKTITVHPDFNDDLTLLHEMIHAYEDQLTYAQGEILTVMLYNKLKSKIKNLDLVLLAWAHYDTQATVNRDQGDHVILFLLKSLDLELRLNFQMGAISGFYSNRKNTLQTPAGKIKIERLLGNQPRE